MTNVTESTKSTSTSDNGQTEYLSQGDAAELTGCCSTSFATLAGRAGVRATRRKVMRGNRIVSIVGYTMQDIERVAAMKGVDTNNKGLKGRKTPPSHESPAPGDGVHFSAAESCQKLGCSAATLHRQARKLRIRSKMVGNVRLYTDHDLARIAKRLANSGQFTMDPAVKRARALRANAVRHGHGIRRPEKPRLQPAPVPQVQATQATPTNPPSESGWVVAAVRGLIDQQVARHGSVSVTMTNRVLPGEHPVMEVTIKIAT
jgi:hypothetical protein